MKSFGKVMSLFLMLMMLGVSSEESRFTKCEVQCILSCGKDSNRPLCYLGCGKRCRAASPQLTPLDHCELGCVTVACLEPETDAKNAKALVDDCSDNCRKSYKQH